MKNATQNREWHTGKTLKIEHYVKVKMFGFRIYN